MPHNPHNRNENGVEDVSAERNPGIRHQCAQRLKIVEGGMLYENVRRHFKEFIQRLKGVIDDVDKRERHKNSHNRQEQEHGNVSADGTVHLVGPWGMKLFQF
jgi:hypothetical protein